MEDFQEEPRSSLSIIYWENNEINPYKGELA